METINIQVQVPNTGKYSLDEFRETYLTKKEQEAYVAETLNRALDQMEAHEKKGTKPMLAKDFLKQLREVG